MGFEEFSGTAGDFVEDICCTLHQHPPRVRVAGSALPTFKSSMKSIDHFQGELDLARRAGGPADDAKAAAADDVGWQTEIDCVEDIEELGAKLQDRKFAVSAMAEGGVLDQGHVKIAEAGGAKGTAPERAETAVVRASSPGDVDGDLKKGTVRRAHAEVILASGAAGGEIRSSEKVGAISAAGACAGLLDSGVNSERRSARQSGDVQELPAFGESLAHWLEKTNAVQR